jgi:hypothetical protein
MARPHPISPAIAVIATVAASVGLGFAVFAQTPEDIFGSPDQTPDQTSNTSVFNQCVTGVCESQRAKCVADAGADSVRLALCESYVTACLDACRAGSTAYKFPALPPPEPEPLTTPSPPPEVDESEPQIDDCERDLWSCGAWSVCSPQGRHTRACKLDLDCPNVQDPSPPTEGACKPNTPPPEATDAIESSLAPSEDDSDQASPGDLADDGTPESEPSATAEPDQDRDAWTEELRTLVQDFEKNTENVSGGFGLSESSGEDGDQPADFSASADAKIDACAALGLSREACRDQLVSGLGFEGCAAAGHVTQESCLSYLTEENEGVFPGCEGLSPQQCDELKRLKTLEYLPAALKEKADLVLQEALDSGRVISLPGITAINAETVGGAAWRRSFAGEGQETSAAVVVIDADKDGLPDDFEAATGIDTPEEAKDMTLDETAQALVSGVPLQQPRGAGEVDPALFFVQVPYSGQLAEDSGFNGGVKISGLCLPGTTCLIYLYSYIPMVLTVTADASGNFEYDIAKNVADGSHVAYVAVTDKTGKIVKKSNPLSFLVKDAQAASADEFLAPPLPAPVAPEESLARYYWIGASALVVLAAGLVWQIRRKPGAVA